MLQLVYGSWEEHRLEGAGLELNSRYLWLCQGSQEEPRDVRRVVSYRGNRFLIEGRLAPDGQPLARETLEIVASDGRSLELRDGRELVGKSERFLLHAWKGAITLSDLLEDKVAELHGDGNWHVAGTHVESTLEIGLPDYFTGLPYAAQIGVRQRLSPLAAERELARTGSGCR